MFGHPVLACVGACLALEVMLKHKIMEDGDFGLLCCWACLLGGTLGAVLWWSLLPSDLSFSSIVIAYLPFACVCAYIGWACYKMLRASWPHR